MARSFPGDGSSALPVRSSATVGGAALETFRVGERDLATFEQVATFLGFASVRALRTLVARNPGCVAGETARLTVSLAMGRRGLAQAEVEALTLRGVSILGLLAQTERAKRLRRALVAAVGEGAVLTPEVMLSGPQALAALSSVLAGAQEQVDAIEAATAPGAADALGVAEDVRQSLDEAAAIVEVQQTGRLARGAAGALLTRDVPRTNGPRSEFQDGSKKKDGWLRLGVATDRRGS